MVHKHHIKKGAKLSIALFVLSLLVISCIGAYLGTRGHRVDFTRYPSGQYEEVSFLSQANDSLPLGGWYLPGESEKVAILVHGWGGNRARLLTLAEYLQKNGINVLTFDVRGGTGRNTYGQREAGDIAGAVSWLTSEKKVSPDQVVIVGVSMGGAASITYALDHPVKKIALVSPVVDITQVKYKVLRDRHFILPQLYAGGATFVERLVYGVNPMNPIEHFDQLKIPILLIHGEKDELSPTKSVRKLQEKLAAAHQMNVQFIYVPEGVHTFLDQDKDHNYKYSQKILEFIQQ